MPPFDRNQGMMESSSSSSTTATTTAAAAAGTLAATAASFLSSSRRTRSRRRDAPRVTAAADQGPERPWPPTAHRSPSPSSSRPNRLRRGHRAPLLLLFAGILVHGTGILRSLQIARSIEQEQAAAPIRPLATAPATTLPSQLVNCRALAAAMRDKDPYQGRPPTYVPVSNAGTPNEFVVFLHPQAFDKVRWDAFRRQRYYETKLEDAWAAVLRQAPPPVGTRSRVLDVGGNIGYFSLFTAAFDKNIVVDTFEPNPINLLRACESLRHNGWSNEFVTTRAQRTVAVGGGRGDGLPPPTAINLWQWGVSDTTGTLRFVPHKNPGAGRIVGSDEAVDTSRPNVAGAPEPLEVTTLDDFARLRGWLEPAAGNGAAGGTDQRNSILGNNSTVRSGSVRIEILKIDVEKHEAQVILGAANLLHSHVIQHIFAEFARDSPRPPQMQALRLLLDTGYTLCGWGNYLGPENGAVPFNVREGDRELFVVHFYEHFLQMRGIAINTWWQLDPTCSVGSPTPSRRRSLRKKKDAGV